MGKRIQDLPRTLSTWKTPINCRYSSKETLARFAFRERIESSNTIAWRVSGSACHASVPARRLALGPTLSRSGDSTALEFILSLFEPRHRRAFQFAVGLAVLEVLALVKLSFAFAEPESH